MHYKAAMSQTPDTLPAHSPFIDSDPAGVRRQPSILARYPEILRDVVSAWTKLSSLRLCEREALSEYLTTHYTWSDLTIPQGDSDPTAIRQRAAQLSNAILELAHTMTGTVSIPSDGWQPIDGLPGVAEVEDYADDEHLEGTLCKCSRCY